MPKWSDDINHHAYNVDTIIFLSDDKTYMQLVMNVIGK